MNQIESPSLNELHSTTKANTLKEKENENENEKENKNQSTDPEKSTQQQLQQQKVYKINDFDMNNLSEKDRKLICDYNLLYSTSYPKLIISLIQPKMISFLQNVLPNLTQNQIINHIVEYINLKFSNSDTVDTSGSFFEDILIYLDSKQETLDENTKETLINTGNSLNAKPNNSSFKKSLKKKALRTNKNKSLKQKKDKKNSRKLSENNSLMRSHYDVSKFGETIFKIS